MLSIIKSTHTKSHHSAVPIHRKSTCATSFGLLRCSAVNIGLETLSHVLDRMQCMHDCVKSRTSPFTSVHQYKQTNGSIFASYPLCLFHHSAIQL